MFYSSLREYSFGWANEKKTQPSELILLNLAAFINSLCNFNLNIAKQFFLNQLCLY